MLISAAILYHSSLQTFLHFSCFVEFGRCAFQQRRTWLSHVLDHIKWTTCSSTLTSFLLVSAVELWSVWGGGCWAVTAYALSLLREVFYGMQWDSSPASTVASSPGAMELHLKMIAKRGWRKKHYYVVLHPLTFNNSKMRLSVTQLRLCVMSDQLFYFLSVQDRGSLLLNLFWTFQHKVSW